jgi:hypothetical protein
MYGFFIVMVSIIVAMNHVPGIRYGLIKSDTGTATGEITAVEEQRHGFRAVVFRFEDHQGRGRAGFVTLRQTFNEDVHAVGQPIEIEFFRFDSRLFFPKEQLDRENGVFIAFLVSLAALTLVIWRFWTSFGSIRNFRAASRRY